MNASRTDDLIHRLTANASPVRPLGRPWTRAMLWCAGALVSVGVMDWAWSRGTPLALSIDSRFVWEQGAALLTALTAAAAAFTSVVPGRSRRLAWLPLAPLAAWLTSVGRQCMQDWSAPGGLPPILGHWGCFPATILFGVIPAVAIVLMLRRGAPVAPRVTTAFAAVAVAGMANFGVRFVHAPDASFIVLAWHILAVFVLSSIVARLGDHVFSWQRIRVI
jgi:hypothetical protein